MSGTAILDTGPLVALLDARDRHHSWATDALGEFRAPLLTCEAVLAEACWLVRKLDGGSSAVIELLKRDAIRIDFDLGRESTRVAELLATYGNVPMSLADACLVRMSEKIPAARIVTLDSDFRVYRRSNRRAVPTLMPR